MESLREGVNLEAYAQKDPKLVYKKQGYELFELMVEKIKENVTETLFRAKGPSQAEIEVMRQKRLEEVREGLKVTLGNDRTEELKGAVGVGLGWVEGGDAAGAGHSDAITLGVVLTSQLAETQPNQHCRNLAWGSPVAMVRLHVGRRPVGAYSRAPDGCLGILVVI